jgi:hypothetical protein
MDGRGAIFGRAGGIDGTHGLASSQKERDKYQKQRKEEDQHSLRPCYTDFRLRPGACAERCKASGKRCPFNHIADWPTKEAYHRANAALLVTQVKDLISSPTCSMMQYDSTLRPLIKALTDVAAAAESYSFKVPQVIPRGQHTAAVIKISSTGGVNPTDTEAVDAGLEGFYDDARDTFFTSAAAAGELESA